MKWVCDTCSYGVPRSSTCCHNCGNTVFRPVGGEPGE